MGYKILLVGSSGSGKNCVNAVVRYNSNGTPDTSF